MYFEENCSVLSKTSIFMQPITQEAPSQRLLLYQNIRESLHEPPHVLFHFKLVQHMHMCNELIGIMILIIAVCRAIAAQRRRALMSRPSNSRDSLSRPVDNTCYWVHLDVNRRLSQASDTPQQKLHPTTTVVSTSWSL